MLNEINESDSDTKKEFRRLLNKFLQDNYGDYRFYSNKMRLFERSNHTHQYYGQLPEDAKTLFIKEKKKDFNLSDIIQRGEKEEENQKKRKTDQPQNLVEALEREMREAKLIEEKEEPVEEKKEEKVEEKKTLIVEVEKEEKKKMEYVINDKHELFMTISIKLGSLLCIRITFFSV